jgi:hypothetical protein
MRFSKPRIAERGFGNIEGLVTFAICAVIVALIFPVTSKLAFRLDQSWIRVVGYSVCGVFAIYGLWGLICQIVQDFSRGRRNQKHNGARDVDKKRDA